MTTPAKRTVILAQTAECKGPGTYADITNCREMNPEEFWEMMGAVLAHMYHEATEDALNHGHPCTVVLSRAQVSLEEVSLMREMGWARMRVAPDKETFEMMEELTELIEVIEGGASTGR